MSSGGFDSHRLPPNVMSEPSESDFEQKTVEWAAKGMIAELQEDYKRVFLSQSKHLLRYSLKPNPKPNPKPKHHPSQKEVENELVFICYQDPEILENTHLLESKFHTPKRDIFR